MKSACVICGNDFENLGNTKTCGAECRVVLRSKTNRNYFHINLKRLSDRCRTRRQANPGKFRDYSRKYYAANLEKLRKYNREYRVAKQRNTLEYNSLWRAAQRLNLPVLILAAMKLKEKLNEQDRDQTV